MILCLQPVRRGKGGAMKKFFAVGKSVQRLDAFAKVTGRAVYVGDMHFEGLLHAKLLRSPYAHARIRNIDTQKAEALPGVKVVLTYRNVPQIPFTICGHSLPFDTPLDSLILSDHLRYVGDPVAAVAAETREIALEALKLIDVEYEQLPFYLLPEESLAVGAVEIHEGSGNITGHTQHEIGDVDSVFSKADYVVEDTYKTPIVTHAQIEPHVSVADIDENGRLTFYLSTQTPTIMRERLAMALGIRRSQVRIVSACVGGGFGGKQEPIYEPLNGLLTQRAGRPVMLELSREENIACTRTRHAGEFSFRTALSREGKILAREMKVVQNTGAYSGHGHNVTLAILGQFFQLYPTDNLRFEGMTVYTNILVGSAMRGYGIPQYVAAMEAHVDHLAGVLGMDPLEFRRKNMYKLGDQVHSDEFCHHTCGLPQILEVGAKAINYEALYKVPKGEGRIKRGVGLAIGSYENCAWPHLCELSGARVMVHDDASATVFIGAAEMGQGASTALLQIAAEALGIPCEWVRVVGGDTDICPVDMGAYASRQTYVTGKAVKDAASQCREQILERAAELLGRPQEELGTCEGWVVDVRDEGRLLSMEEVMSAMTYDKSRGALVCHDAWNIPKENSLTYVGTFADVEVDTETGQVEVKKLVTCMDCGTLINPLAAMGQLTGGTIMSCGYGLMEQVLIDSKTGRVLNDNLLDYKIPTFADVPEIEAFFVETYEPSSAYGNKSLGEPPNITPAAAIRNAVCNAIGLPINSNPLTPERVFSALDEKSMTQGGEELCIA